ncbi:LysR substrate-binding domain-containing protein [Trinickia sp. LjRoot230]|uniref:LysR substrate-binding domain-containing protein n=1 Tax=Trinickia sp. LjRoot230 TaxID=3342288 RepID=UPI003ECFD734
METALRSRLRLRHIHCFLAIAQERSLGRAAEQLHLSQPAVSKTLVELESLAGVELVERGRHGARLTAAGEHFLRYAIDIEHALESAGAALSGEATPSPAPLEIGALPTVASGLVPDALVRLRALRPHAGVRLRTATNAVLLSALKSGELDFVIGRMAEPSAMQGLSFELLYAEPLVMAVRPRHPLLAAGTVSLPAVLAYPLIVAPAGTVPRLNTDAYFDAHALRVPSACVETLSVSVARLLARRSDAVWITPERAARDDIETRLLCALDLPMRGAEEPVGIIWRSAGDTSELAQTLAEILRTLAHEKPRTRGKRATGA